MAVACPQDFHGINLWREKAITQIQNESIKKIGVKLKSFMTIIRIIVKNTGIAMIHYLITSLINVVFALE